MHSLAPTSAGPLLAVKPAAAAALAAALSQHVEGVSAGQAVLLRGPPAGRAGLVAGCRQTPEAVSHPGGRGWAVFPAKVLKCMRGMLAPPSLNRSTQTDAPGDLPLPPKHDFRWPEVQFQEIIVFKNGTGNQQLGKMEIAGKETKLFPMMICLMRSRACITPFSQPRSPQPGVNRVTLPSPAPSGIRRGRALSSSL